MIELAAVAVVATVAALLGLGIGRLVAGHLGRVAEIGEDEHDRPDSA
ncbi:MAG TPA: hypothetical protein VH720_07680 [Candidatus Limnocylindrales bacterium]